MYSMSSGASLTRVVASLAIPPGWLRNASLASSPRRLKGTAILWGKFANMYQNQTLWPLTTGRSLEVQRRQSGQAALRMMDGLAAGSPKY